MNTPGRVLVTGGVGFIGSHVVDALVGLGHDVAILDDLSTGDRANLNPSARFYQGSVTDPEVLEQAFREVAPRWVSHHAAQISVTQSVEDPVADAKINVLGSLMVLEACRRHGVEHLTFASTGGALYGDPEEVPCDESAPVRPKAPYGAAKYAVETYLDVYRSTWGFKSAALRYGNVYGPRQSHRGEAGVIAIFANRMLQGQQPTIFGDGDQARDFVYVADVVQANLIAMERHLDGVFNVGTGTATSVNTVVEVLRRHCGYVGAVAHAPERPGEARRIALDAGRFAEATGWRPSVSLDEGVQATVDYFRQATATGPRPDRSAG